MRRAGYKVILLILLSVLPNVRGNGQILVQPDTAKRKEFLPNPQKSTMIASIFPGLGQVYNRKYWKLPLVYGGFGAIGYAVSYNSTNHSRFLEAYQDFTDKIPETQSYLKIITNADPATYDPVLHPDTYRLSDAQWISEQLLARVDYFRRYRDLSYIGLAAWYLVTILDANVDASLYDYDISTNIEAFVAPVPMIDNEMGKFGVSMGIVITF